MHNNYQLPQTVTQNDQKKTTDFSFIVNKPLYIVNPYFVIPDILC